MGLTAQMDESVVSLEADLGGWGDCCTGFVLRMGGCAGTHVMAAGIDVSVLSITADLGEFFQNECAVMLWQSPGAGLNISGPAYKYTSAAAFSYDGGAVDISGAH